jgi:alkylhydroperoxidase/carboxymuconolactone decarboxylase family protein YurZ
MPILFAEFMGKWIHCCYQVWREKAEKEGKPAELTMRHTTRSLCLLAIASLLSGCEALGVETATQINAKKDAEAKAIGSACRHAVRSVESCFGSNPRAGKAAVFAGWKEMDQYMRDNEILGMPSEAAGSQSVNEPATDAPSTDPNAQDKASRRS